MPTGHYPRKRRAEYVKFTCRNCRKEFEKCPSEVRQREERGGNPIQFCSRACTRGFLLSPHVERSCGTCGVVVTVRVSRLKYNSNWFCSQGCMGASKKVEGAKWRDPEQIKEYMRQYRVVNREKLRPKVFINLVNRRARKRGNGGSVTIKEWESLKRQHDYRCLACGKQEPDIALQMDHVIPVSKGGSSFISNIQPLCGKCNRSKSATRVDYRRTQQRLIEL